MWVLQLVGEDGAPVGAAESFDNAEAAKAAAPAASWGPRTGGWISAPDWDSDERWTVQRADPDRLAVKKIVVPVWPFFWRVVIHDATTGVWLTGYFGRAQSRSDAHRQIDEKVERTRRHKGEYGS